MENKQIYWEGEPSDIQHVFNAIMEKLDALETQINEFTEFCDSSEQTIKKEND